MHYERNSSHHFDKRDFMGIGPREHPARLRIDEEIQEKEVREALQHVASNKATGPDRIPNRILKAAEE